MGVNANFTAEFGSFLQALNQADQKLADFGANADKVGDQLNRMVDKFSGVKMIQQANELVKVVNDLGGATTLTEKEQAKLNATLTEAIEKYHAIGETVPADMQKLADETKGAATTTTNWVSTLKDLAGAFGIAFSVGAVVQFGRELFADAQALDTLSKQTRTSVEDLVILRGATESYGIGADELGRALFTLRERIAGGDQSVATAYARMGLSMDEVRAKQNDSVGLLALTERGLAGVSSEAQELASKELYPSKLAAGMLGIAKGFDDLLEKSQIANKGVGESTKVMAEYADAIDRAERSLKNIATIVVGAPLTGLDALSNATKEHVSWWKLMAAAIEDYRLKAGGEIFAGVANGLADLAKKQYEVVGPTEQATAALTKQGEAAVFMANIQMNASKPLLEWQVTYLDQLREMGILDAQHATGIKVTAEQLQQYKADLDTVKKADEDLAKAEAERAKAQAEADKIALDSYKERIKSLETVTQATLKAYSFDGQISQLQALQAAEEDLARSVYAQITSEKDRMKILEDLAAKRTAIATQMNKLEQDHAKVVNDQVIAELDAKTKVLAAYGQQADGTLKINDAQTTLQRSLDDLHRKKEEGISQYYQEQALMDKFIKDQNAEVQAVDAATAAHDRETAAIQRKADARDSFSLAGGAPVPDKFKGMSNIQLHSMGYLDMYDRVTVMGEQAGLGDSGGPIRPRAAGGPVTAGSAYLVGEQGPELFVPSQSGSITPNGAGTVVHNTFHIVDTESNIARRVSDLITRSVMRSTRLS